MNGELRIVVTEEAVRVSGVLKDSSPLDHVTIIDALMNAFDMKGKKRKLACNLLTSVDEAKAKLSEGDLEDLFEKLFSNLKEN